MRKTDLSFDVIGTLKDVSDRCVPTLRQLLEAKIPEREQRLLRYVFANYYQAGRIMRRWYDPYHILFSTIFATELVKTDKRMSPLIISSIILHDIGYSAIPDKINLNNPQARILHMQEGASISAKVLMRVGSFNANEIGIVVGMIATHDNWILNIPTADPNRLSLIDADKIFVMSFISFYKDWIGEEGKNLFLQKFFDSRCDSFYKGRHLLSTKLARQWRDNQFEARLQEIQNNIIKDQNTFQAYAENYLQAEIEALNG